LRRADSPIRDDSRRPAWIYYVGQTFEVAFLETIACDLTNGNQATRLLSAKDLADCVNVPGTVMAHLDLPICVGGTPSPWACRPMP
jgi:hypothetical protein